MADLDVFHVQRLLREYAQKGHDVLSTPNKVGLHGKAYGLVTHNNLYVAPEAHEGSLITELMQSERPVLSRVHSKHGVGPVGVSMLVRKNLGGTPPMVIYGHSGSHIKGEYVPGRGDWEPGPHVNDLFYKTPNDALEAHTRVPHEENEEDFKGIDPMSVLRTRSFTDPFSGLIGVYHRTSNSNVVQSADYSRYIYNPKTEEFRKF
jgi:hypothetical protein